MIIRLSASRQFVEPETKKRTYAFKNRVVELDDKWADESYVGHWFYAALLEMGILEILEAPAAKATADDSATAKTTKSTKKA